MSDERLETSAAPAGSQGRFWRELVVVGLVLAAVFAAVEVTLSGRLARDLVRTLVFDIQSPRSIFAKIDGLRRQRDFKVVVLGDSLIVGLTMKEHGDPRWSDHTIPVQLEQRLQQLLPDRKVSVTNLGLNGALPRDYAHLAEMLRAAKPDLVLCDLILRSFSDDFNTPKTEHSRDWLERIAIDREGRYRETIRTATRGDPVESWAVSFGVNHSRLFAYRELLQQELLGNSPRGLCDSLRDRLREALRSPEAEAVDPDVAQAMLTIKVRRRCNSINFSPDHRQRTGLEALLQLCRTESWKLLLFYAQEDPDRIDDVIDPQRYKEARRSLRAVIAPYLSNDLRYFDEPIPQSPSNYLDLAHLNEDGCRTLVHALEPELRRLLPITAPPVPETRND